MGVWHSKASFLEGAREAAGSWVSLSQLVPLHGTDPHAGPGRAVNIWISPPVGFGQGPSPWNGVAENPSWIWMPATSLPSAQQSPPLEEMVKVGSGPWPPHSR